MPKKRDGYKLDDSEILPPKSKEEYEQRGKEAEADLKKEAEAGRVDDADDLPEEG